MDARYIVDGPSSTTFEKVARRAPRPHGSEPSVKRQRLTNTSTSSLALRHPPDSISSSAFHPFPFNPHTTSTNLLTDPMADGSTSKRSKSTASANDGPENEARALRVLEIMNDFRTVQVHITSLVTRAEASPPDQAAYYLDGYVVLRQCNAEAQAILATHYNPGSLGLEGGRVPDTELQKATLQR